MAQRPLIDSHILPLAVNRPDVTSYTPALYDPAIARHRACIRRLVESGAIVADVLFHQLDELVTLREPSHELSTEERLAASRSLLGDCAPELYGRWVYYPWSSKIVHILPPNEFFEVRTNRNRNKITLGEQRLLRERTIGIIGLSVGQSSAVTLALEGVGGRFRLADFDTLSLSNMNRLRAGVDEIGIKKAVLSARRMFEIDPYLDICVWEDGLSPDNFDDFVFANGPLDLVIEECDDFYVKIAVREYARSKRIPVLMETSDRGLIEIERFDLEPERPVLHGLLDGVRAEDVRTLSTKDKIPYVLRIHNEEVLSSRLRGSLVEVKESIYSWPQLASSVTLGGALITDVSRRILLGMLRASGRFSVDVEELVSEGRQAYIGTPSPLVPLVVEEALRPRRLEIPAAAQGPLTEEEVRFLVGCALLAPSAGNAQPWGFHCRNSNIEVFLTRAGKRSVLHYGEPATLVAFGAVAENMRVAGQTIGLSIMIDYRFFAGSDCVFTASFRRTDARPPSDLDALFNRVSNRRHGENRSLETVHRDHLARAALQAGGDIVILNEHAKLKQVGEVLGLSDRAALLSQTLHGEFMEEIRWTPDQVCETRTGIDLASLELSHADAAAMRVIAKWTTLDAVRRWDGGSSLQKLARDAARGSSAFALVRSKGKGRRAYFDGGMVAERVWHAATELGVAVQPWTALLFLFLRIRERVEELEQDTIRRLFAVERAFRMLFPEKDDMTDVLLLRLAYAAPPTSRSLRKNLEQVLIFEA